MKGLDISITTVAIFALGMAIIAIAAVMMDGSLSDLESWIRNMSYIETPGENSQ